MTTQIVRRFSACETSDCASDRGRRDIEVLREGVRNVGNTMASEQALGCLDDGRGRAVWRVLPGVNVDRRLERIVHATKEPNQVPCKGPRVRDPMHWTERMIFAKKSRSSDWASNVLPDSVATSSGIIRRS